MLTVSVLAGVVATAISIFVAALFLHAGVSKWRSPGAYRETVAAVLGERGVNHAVRCLAAIEVAVAVLVAFPGSRVPGLLVSCAVLAGYAGVMAYQLRWGEANLRCGCSGPASDTRIGSELVWRNLLLAGAALWASSTAIAREANGLGLAVGLALVILVVYAALDQWVQNRQRWVRGVHI